LPLIGAGALTSERFLGLHEANCAKFGEDTAPSSAFSAFREFVLDFSYIAAFRNAGGSKAKIEAQFRTFVPPVKIREEMAYLLVHNWSAVAGSQVRAKKRKFISKI